MNVHCGDQMKKMVGIFALLIVATTLFSGLASAAPNFTATDPQDVTDPDFDIVEAGAYPDGDYIVFWMKVRGQINLNPANNSEHDYLINVYFHNNVITLDLTAFNFGSYKKLASMTVNYDVSTLTEGKDYVISDNKLSFYVDKNIQNIGSIENTDISTVSFETGRSGIVGDTLYWEPGSSSGISSGGGSTVSPEPPSWIWFLPGIWGIVGSIIWFIIWLLIGLWAYKDAKSRGDEHAILWFLVVFLLGLIGLIIYLVVGRKERK